MAVNDELVVRDITLQIPLSESTQLFHSTLGTNQTLSIRQQLHQKYFVGFVVPLLTMYTTTKKKY